MDWPRARNTIVATTTTFLDDVVVGQTLCRGARANILHARCVGPRVRTNLAKPGANQRLRNLEKFEVALEGLQGFVRH
eukprot:11160402-Lingulodinium_polyedra.AAC.1